MQLKRKTCVLDSFPCRLIWRVGRRILNHWQIIKTFPKQEMEIFLLVNILVNVSFSKHSVA